MRFRLGRRASSWSGVDGQAAGPAKLDRTTADDGGRPRPSTDCRMGGSTGAEHSHAGRPDRAGPSGVAQPRTCRGVEGPVGEAAVGLAHLAACHRRAPTRVHLARTTQVDSAELTAVRADDGSQRSERFSHHRVVYFIVGGVFAIWWGRRERRARYAPDDRAPTGSAANLRLLRVFIETLLWPVTLVAYLIGSARGRRWPWFWPAR